MEKPNPSFKKRRRERAKKERREEKARRKAERKAATENAPSVEGQTVEGESDKGASTEQLMKKGAKTFLVPAVLILVTALCFLLGYFHSRVHTDMHHWSIQYSAAADLLQGLEPYSETLSPYGFFTNCIHALALLVLGNSLVSLGTVTSLIYSISFPLMYLVVRGFLPRVLSLTTVLVLFILHPYIRYPWANYIAYSCLLASLALLRGNHGSAAFSGRAFFSGLLLSLSLLSRNTFVISLLPSFLAVALLAGWRIPGVVPARIGRPYLLGLIIPLGAFLLYLSKESLVSAWLEQTFFLYNDSWYQQLSIPDTSHQGIVAALTGRRLDAIMSGFFSSDARLQVYSAVFFVCAAMSAYFAYLTLRTRERKSCFLLLLSLLAFFGFFQSPHTFVVWRLQLSSGLGVGIGIYAIYKLIGRERITAAVVVMLLGGGFLLNSGTPRPPYEQFGEFGDVVKRLRSYARGELLEPRGIELLSGKLLPVREANAYEEISRLVSSCRGLDSIVTMSNEASLFYLVPGLSKVQIAPYIGGGLSPSFLLREGERIRQAIHEERSVLLINKALAHVGPQNYRWIGSVRVQRPEGLVTVGVAVPKGITEARGEPSGGAAK